MECEIKGKPNQAILVNEFGMPHKHYDGEVWPICSDPARILKTYEEWEPLPDDVFIACGPGSPGSGNLVEQLVAMAECRPKGADGEYLVVEKEVSCGTFNFMPEVRTGRCRRAVVTKCPPWLLPQHISRHGAGRTDSFPAPWRAVLGSKVVVLCSDPRYMLMREFGIWQSYPRVSFPSSEAKALEKGPFLEHVLQSNMHRFGGVLKTVATWAKVAADNPDQVRLFFVEDFVSDPQAAVRGLAEFLHVSTCSANVELAISRVEQALSSGLLLHPEDARPGAELDVIRSYICDFEEHLATLPAETRSGWEDLMRSWTRLPHARLAAIAAMVAEHGLWDPPRWWSAHFARSCRPCTFWLDRRCRHGEDCPFCHGPGHVHSKRPSKKLRDRRDRRRGTARTPSPEGLSS